MEGAPDANLLVATACREDGSARIIRVNEALEALLEYAPGELVGQPLDVLHHNRVTVDEIARGMLVAHDGGEVAGGTLLSKKNGEVVFVEWSGRQVRDSAHGTMLEVTGRVAERRKVRRGEPGAEKLLADTIDAIALLAHDIRGPLNTVIGYADLIGETPDLADEVNDHVRMIVRAANRVLDMTNEIALASRLDRNEYAVYVEPFELLSLIESTVTLLPGAERVQFEFAADRIDIAGDLAGIRHIVANLTSNALKYSPDPAPVHIAASCDGETALIRVRDEGIGIPANELPLVFDRFTRASNARTSGARGTGLGLYFVKQLVERSGGTIALESQVGRGTNVSVTLPARPPS